MDPILCSACPICGTRMRMRFSATQAACVNDDCDVLVWNPLATLDENLCNAGKAQVISNPAPPVGGTD